MEYADQITIIIVFRIDSFERRRNLDAVLRYLYPIGIRILMLEADKESLYQVDGAYKMVEYFFTHDEDVTFYRTLYLNQLLKKCVTPVVLVWDADVILPYSQLEMAVRSIIEEGHLLVIPYNESVMYLSEEETTDYIAYGGGVEYLQLYAKSYNRWLGRPSCGGLFVVDRKKYLNCGGENEHFYGWGPEDAERLRRVEILGYPVVRIRRGPLFHLWHPRNENSGYRTNEQAYTNNKEFVKVCCMEREELQEYIESWKTLKTL